MLPLQTLLLTLASFNDIFSTTWRMLVSLIFRSAYHSVYLGLFPVYTLSFCTFCSLIPVLSNGTCFMQLRRGETKRARLKRTLVGRGTIEPSVNNGFPTRSGKRQQLETLDLESRLIGLQKRWQSRRLLLLVCWQWTLKTYRKPRCR